MTDNHSNTDSETDADIPDTDPMHQTEDGYVYIDDIEMLSSLPQLHLGSFMRATDPEPLDDGRYKAALILNRPVILTPGEDQPDMAYPQFTALGTIEAVPVTDDVYRVEFPDAEAYSTVLGEYLDQEMKIRTGILDEVQHRLAETLNKHDQSELPLADGAHPLADREVSAMDAFELGRQVGEVAQAKELYEFITERTENTEFDWEMVENLENTRDSDELQD